MHMDTAKLPDFFKPILWSYDFSQIDPEKQKKVIIVNAINYGDLRHWRWLAQHYGKDAVKETLEHIPRTELRTRAEKLASLLFPINSFNNAPRGVHRTK